MAIPSRQIGWGTQENLLWQIAKQLEGLGCQLCDVGIPGPPGPQGPPGDITNLFYGSFIFDHATTLTAEMNSNTTAPIQVVSTTGFFAPGYLRIGKEIIGYTGVTPTTFTGITRGLAGSGGSTHGIGGGVAQAQITAANVPTQVKIDETELSSGVTLDVLTGTITILNAGVYNVQFSVQIENFSNDFEETVLWFKVNGNPVPKSASYVTTVAEHGGTPGAAIMTINIFYTFAANDTVALEWVSKGGKTAITSIPPSGSIPQSPGVILTVNKIGT